VFAAAWSIASTPATEYSRRFFRLIFELCRNEQTTMAAWSLMNWLIYILSLLRSILSVRQSTCRARVSQRFSSDSPLWRSQMATLEHRSFVGWLQHVPEHSLCARPPCWAQQHQVLQRFGSDGPAGPGGFASQ
jgi:hypothetical protein